MNDADPIAFLTERLASAERERDELSVKAERLTALQRVFVQISASRDEMQIAHFALRGAWLALEFTRAMWFTVDASGTASARFDVDGSDEPVESEYGGIFPTGSALSRCAHGESDAAAGYAHDADAPLFDTRGWFALAAVRVAHGESAVIYADGSRERTLSPWSVTALGELAIHAALALENVRMQAELERLALHDPLTGLLNRRALDDRLAIELARARRTGEQLGFAMIDVDDFKQINDSRGHAGGDTALKTLADVMRETVRETDIPARFAGDEFALIMPDTDRLAATVVMDRFYASLRNAGLACSTGIAFVPGDAGDERKLLEAADAGVYVAKRAGKNTYRFAAPPIRAL
jgi:diguanylate cyclase (GGDEF)-like protein